MDKILKKVSFFYQALAFIFLLALFTSVLIQIVMRNIFNAGSIHLEELARLSLVSMVFLMIPVLFFEGKHIIVDIVTTYLPKAFYRWLKAGTDFLVVLFGIYILNAIATIMERNWNVRTPALAIPNAVFYIPITLGILGMCVFSLNDIYKFFTNKELAQ
ncbi:MAG TPA: TRAP transporter small permease [Sphaerochaeta sp.]|jgi:TRAP-type C4-dicarboxylate transport system permease small subunit|nr:TRAP transporter small permease [Sphaerochaeta sp.]HQB54517.1 TRAP transporter small permease [Sphaerochaeta sp.]